MADGDHTRRDVAAALAGLGGLAACAQVPLHGSAPVQVGLASEEDGEDLASAGDAARRMTAPVYVNGSGPYDFVVDTGANVSVISIELALKLGLPDAGNAPVHGIAGIELVPQVMIDRLDVGAVTSRRVRAPILPAQRMAAPGLLGVDVLKQRRLTLDFKGRRLQVARSEDPRPAPGADDVVVSVPARYRFGQLVIIDASVAGQPVTAFLDSGAQDTIGNRHLQRRVAPGAEDRLEAVEVRLLSATSQTIPGFLATLPRLRIGKLALGGVPVVFSDLHIFELWGLQDEPALLIGADVMRQFDAVELDYGRRLVSFSLSASGLSSG